MSEKVSTSFIAVFDIGKTNIKLSLLDRASGAIATSESTENRVLTTGIYPCADTTHIWHWLTAQLRRWSGQYPISGIGITTHGATLACLAGDELVLPVLDYEYSALDADRDAYNSVRPGFDETLSPALPFGLNLGAQLFWLQTHFPGEIARCDKFLMYPQYWGYRLSGTAVSEATSLGCHTDLWNPDTKDFSSLVSTQGWRQRFPALCPAGQSLGRIRPALAQDLGLPSDCEIYNGIHDSNASLVPHLLTQKAPFAVVSSGTWTIIAGIGSPTRCLDKHKDMLANVNAFGDPTACIRFMGGREWQAIAGTEAAEEEDFLSLIRRGVLALPAFSDQGGPFRHCLGRFVGAQHESLSEGEKTALASLYLALMTDHCLDLLEQNSAVIIEGAFARNPWLLKILASLRGGQKILFSEDATGTTLGTASLCNKVSAHNWPLDLHAAAPCELLDKVIAAYKQQWRDHLPEPL